MEPRKTSPDLPGPPDPWTALVLSWITDEPEAECWIRDRWRTAPGDLPLAVLDWVAHQADWQPRDSLLWDVARLAFRRVNWAEVARELRRRYRETGAGRGGRVR